MNIKFSVYIVVCSLTLKSLTLNKTIPDFVPGIKHMRHGCHECHVPIIRGTRWSCSHCKEANLCTDCYMKARHNNRHKFYRHDDDHSEPLVKFCICVIKVISLFFTAQ